MIHPSKDIMFKKSRRLEGKKIALCLCGSVGIIKSPELARELMRNGAEVFVVMSPSSQKLISPTLMEWATGNPVVTELTGKIEHILLGKNVDLVLVAPATSNTISKIASGIDDTPVTSLVISAMGYGIPILIVPAMHASMYSNPIVLENIKKLTSMGIKVIEPQIMEDKAKFPDIEIIIEEVISIFTKKDLKGVSILVTAGPTRSYIDSIRYITNGSSGKMGYAFAKEAYLRGADVTLVSGPTNLPIPRNIKMINVETTEEMLKTIEELLSRNKYDLFVMAAAPLDFKVENKYEGKISSNNKFSINLSPLPKIINIVREKSENTFIIGFKAEYGLSKEELISRALEKLKEAKADLIVANSLSNPFTGFNSDYNEVYVVDKEGNVVHIPISSKHEIANRILDIYLEARRR
ncbi:MAG: bifunctional phosphopantothenoylcysteine decarboxylase/phosphopantothenate--cysteine ligase CoaBC [Candidatus Methanomethylicota archaeon]|uniref:Coenzyme A biosynthesis bifunctional protein CoaBC n=1 Tax=Thermoproteota archaeon TaxID=2056631 RepID=A0A520KH55_9CREN|nr:MAG: bifunctional phosphopantothenoylcysteine decarboxylase/phosphopantothenate--cysteine ligase CoaBC [Candidatus Verstraetearchaeota archaeon]TDA38643.1 MAG: bifunctional phosphopantothenoylcysteine decarboxylase/phosphopantothenate--cysteine ligase CoaBC [Candidatus Verstraetearchaeota archaeon]